MISSLAMQEGGVILDVCLFLLSFSENHLGKHTADTDRILLL